jgi:hypothetical protein
MMQTGNITGFALAVLVGAAATASPSAAASFTPDPRGIDVAKFFIADDVRLGIFATGKAVFHYDKWIGPYIKTTPQQIEQDYNNNEVSADEKYKDQLIVFSGQINSVSKDLFSNLYVTVETGKLFSDIHAEMDEDTAAVSKLSKGGRIALVCKGASYLITSPVLHHCHLRDGYMLAQEQQAADDVAGWLNGSVVPPFLDTPEMRTIAFYLYFSGTKIPHPEDCTREPGGNVADCAKQLKAAKPTRNEIKSAMDAARDELGLSAEPPALPGRH